jgi:hypothetical protein
MTKVKFTMEFEGDEEEIQNILGTLAKSLPETVKVKQSNSDSLSDREVRRLRGIIAANTPLC